MFLKCIIYGANKNGKARDEKNAIVSQKAGCPLDEKALCSRVNNLINIGTINYFIHFNLTATRKV